MSGKSKNLRFTPDQRQLLDTLRQYLGVGSETEAGARGIQTLGEQLVAAYLAAGVHPHRCDVLVASLNAAAEDGIPTRPTYQVDPERRELLRWHPPSATYRPVVPALAAWLPVA
jgi:hypothetical protein